MNLPDDTTNKYFLDYINQRRQSIIFLFFLTDCRLQYKKLEFEVHVHGDPIGKTE
jgi:hypothetical protein